MKYGLTKSEFTFLLNALVLPLKALHARVFLFGSRATGKYQKFSDIDLLFVENPENKIQPSELYLILSKIEESAFPFKVDLVNYSELASSYKTTVDQQKIEL
jgi:predicted nucleotidyltransferase